MKKLLLIITITITILLSLTPFLFFLLTSFKSKGEISAIPPTLWPSWSLDSYVSIFKTYSLGQYLKNSLVVASMTTIINMIAATGCAYALSRLPIRGKRPLLFLLLMVAMFPQMVLAGPIWQILKSWNLLNTSAGLVMSYVALTLPLSVWILAVFFKNFPDELEEAARLDGCSRLRALIQIVLPLAAPGIFTAAILVFIYAWNEFFLALLFMTNPVVQTLPLGIVMFQGEHTMPWGEIAAASTVATLPLVVLVLLFQKRIITGLSAGAIKG